MDAREREEALLEAARAGSAEQLIASVGNNGADQAADEVKAAARSLASRYLQLVGRTVLSPTTAKWF